MMLTGLKLKVFFLNEETKKARDTGMDYNINECDVRIMIFYHIDNIVPYIDKDKDTGNLSHYTQIISGGETYTSPLPIEDVAEAIDDHLTSSIFFLKS